MALQVLAMPVYLWCLFGIAGWTLALLTAVASMRVSRVLTGKAQPNAFPAGVPHGSDGYWRLNRAHLNCAENLPILATLLLIIRFLQLDQRIVDISHVDAIALVYLGARVCQSIAHLSSGSSRVVNIRFTFFVVQLGCVIALMVVIARAAG